MTLGQPDFSLVEKHHDYIQKWKIAVMNRMNELYDKYQRIQPCVYTVGYDYSSGRYEEITSPVQLYIMQDANEKWNLYTFLKNIESVLPWQPLAMIIMSPGLVEDQIRDPSTHQVLEQRSHMTVNVLFQTRLTFTRYVFVEDERMINTDGQLTTIKKLVHHDRYAKMPMSGDVDLFQSVFCLDKTRN
jgi:hypothetical protein